MSEKSGRASENHVEAITSDQASSGSADLNLLRIMGHGAAGLGAGAGVHVMENQFHVLMSPVNDFVRNDFRNQVTLGSQEVLASKLVWQQNVFRDFDQTVKSTQDLERKLARVIDYAPTPLPETGLPAGRSADAVRKQADWLGQARANLRSEAPSLLASSSVDRNNLGWQIGALAESQGAAAENATFAASGKNWAVTRPSDAAGATQLLSATESGAKPWLDHVYSQQLKAATDCRLWEKELQRRFGYEPTVPANGVRAVRSDIEVLLGLKGSAPPSYWAVEASPAVRNEWLGLSVQRQTDFLATNARPLMENDASVFAAATERNAYYKRVFAATDAALNAEAKMAGLHTLESNISGMSHRPTLGSAIGQTVLATGAVLGADFVASQVTGGVFGEDSTARRIMQPNVFGTMAATAFMLSAGNLETRLLRSSLAWAGGKVLNVAMDQEIQRRL